MKHADFLKQLRQEEIVDAVRRAELRTSGEIRVFVSRKRFGDPVAAARRAFEELGMTETRERNGVLVFVAPRMRRFAVVGDTAVHAKCGDAFWQELTRTLSGHFGKGEFSEGILHAVAKAGALLSEHFPHRRNDRDELPDQVAHD